MVESLAWTEKCSDVNCITAIEIHKFKKTNTWTKCGKSCGNNAKAIAIPIYRVLLYFVMHCLVLSFFSVTCNLLQVFGALNLFHMFLRHSQV